MTPSHENHVRVFTDEDLERFKTGWSKPSSEYRVKTEILQGLLARLEAAEEALEIYAENFHGYDDDSTEAVKAWRKVSGKDLP